MQRLKLPDFKSAILFRKAMSHKSYANEQNQPEQSNERLEFLGDAILTFLCGEFLYDKYPHLPEGELTKLRSSLVDKNQLSDFALALALNKRLFLGKGVENSGGRENPRLLSSAFEALIGAYFLDQDADITPVRAYVNPLFQVALAQRGEADPVVNYKSQLQEWSLAEFGEVPKYQIIAESGPDHAKYFTAEVLIQGEQYGVGKGAKKQDAEKKAARSALERLGLL
ncbi:MAG: ribonuclease III [Cyanobacteria bacterium]|nr:ribonuclease III [Cyanobacteriota bacterium]